MRGEGARPPVERGLQAPAGAGTSVSHAVERCGRSRFAGAVASASASAAAVAAADGSQARFYWRM